MPCQFNPKTFVPEVNKLLARGEGAKQTLIDAWLWAYHHLKEVKRCFPGYSQEWLKTQIGRVFNINVEVYVRTAAKIGGGKSPEAMRKGYDFISRFSSYECMRAERMLRAEDMEALPKKVPENATNDDLRAIVDNLAQNLKTLKPQQSNVKPINYQREYKRLVRENKRLREENASLRRRLEIIEAAVSS